MFCPHKVSEHACVYAVLILASGVMSLLLNHLKILKYLNTFLSSKHALHACIGVILQLEQVQ